MAWQTIGTCRCCCTIECHVIIIIIVVAVGCIQCSECWSFDSVHSTLRYQGIFFVCLFLFQVFYILKSEKIRHYPMQAHMLQKYKH